MATKVKISLIVEDKPVSIILHRSETDDKLRKIEVNNNKFSNQKMARAYLEAMGVDGEKVTQILAYKGVGELFEGAVPVPDNQPETVKLTDLQETENALETLEAKTPERPKRTSKKKESAEPLMFRTFAFRTGKTVLVLTITDGKTDEPFCIDDLVSRVSVNCDKQALSDLLSSQYGIGLPTVSRMLKGKLALTAAEYSEYKNKIAQYEGLEDAGVLGQRAKVQKEARKKSEPIPGYPKWVLRDPQDTIQYHLMEEARNNGYSAKIMETLRQTNGSISVTFEEDMMWHTNINVNAEYVNPELMERITRLSAGDMSKNQSLTSTEKRYCILLARAMSATYQLAFDEHKDVRLVDVEGFNCKKRRATAYNR